MSQTLLNDEIEMWHGHHDLNVNKLEEILFIQDDADNGCFIEIDINYPDNIKRKTISFCS